MKRYGWGFFGPEDDPDERGTAWIEIGPLEKSDDDGIEYLTGDSLAEIIMRDFDKNKVEHPEWFEYNQKDAELICSALNVREAVLEAIAQGFTFPSYVLDLLKDDEDAS